MKKKAVDITAGKGYDVMKEMYEPDPRNPQQSIDIPTREEVRAAANKAYADVPDLFTWFATPDPAKTGPAIENMWVVVRGLGSEPDPKKKTDEPAYPIKHDHWSPNVALYERSGTIKSAVTTNWDGEAARAFDYNFVGHINTTISMQARLAAVLAVSLQAHKAVRDCFHTDIWKLGNHTLKALDTVTDCNGDDVESMLTVFTAIAGVALAVPTDGVSLVALAGLGKEGVSAAKEVKGALRAKGKRGKSVQIGGPTVDAVITSLRSAVSTLQGGASGQEYDLYQFIHGFGIQADTEWDKYVVPRPASLTALDHAGIGKLDGDYQFYDR